MPLVRLVYFSESQLDQAGASVLSQLTTIMSVSQRNNKRDEITGALVFDNGWFLQALEGERAAVTTTYARIGQDNRHSGVVLVEQIEVAARVFGGWSMRLAQRNSENSAAFEIFTNGPHLRPALMNALDILGLIRMVVRSDMPHKK